MSAQSVASRSRQSKSVDTDDVVLSRAIEFSHWARNNVRLIVVGAVLLLAVVGGALYYRTYQAERMERAASEFMQLEQTLAAGNPQLAQRELERYIGRFEGTAYADEASVALAQLHLEAGEPQQAIGALQGVAGRIGDSPVGPQAALLLASAQETAGEREAAIATYLRVADRAPLAFHKQEALAAAAALRELDGNFAGAAELYGRLVQLSEEGSLEASVYEMRRAEAEARAAAQ